MVDSPEQNAAMIEKLDLPFPILSDPDREQAIGPYGVAHLTDPRNIAKPAIVVIAPTGEEAFRVESGDFADRVPEDDLIERLAELDLAPVSQEPPQRGPAEPGPKAMPFRALSPYYRGARFAAVALAMRHPEIKDEVDHYVAQMDRYLEAVRELKEREARG